jgi:hypothetical protein
MPSSAESDADRPKIVFAPGCFDGFEGTQEELQDLIAELHRMLESGELFEKSKPISDDEMDEIMGRKNEPRQ